MSQKAYTAGVRPRTPRTGQDGIGAGTLVMTTLGELPVEFLEAGDRLVTRSGVHTLRWTHSFIADGAFLVAPHEIGARRPEAVIALGPGQVMHLRGWMARALANAPCTDVAIRDLVDGAYISATLEPTRLWQLGFDRAEVIQAGGMELKVPGEAAPDLRPSRRAARTSPTPPSTR